MTKVQKWDFMEVAVKGEAVENPFAGPVVTGTFTGDHEEITVEGFFDGDDCYRVRFMPSYEGHYRYRITGNVLSGEVSGEFDVMPAAEGNHGRVQVVDGRYLGYEDGTPYYSVGTTCYAWVHQSEELQNQTLETLAAAPFNKIRFCIYPKYYEFNRSEPLTYPYERGNGEGFDRALAEKTERERKNYPGTEPAEMDYGFNYYRLNTEHFKRIDRRIAQLRDLGIEADLILMHPYDRWGMNVMKAECCDLYIRYLAARYGAYRNVWWSLANEYDLILSKTTDDWERYASILCDKDPYDHLRSIHNCMKLYDYSQDWITHVSIQRQDFCKTTEYTDEYLDKYGKPVVWDEICYEGNIHTGWGNITAQELVRRFWEAFLRGGHAGHGETYLDEKDILWWSHGGVLKGQSVERLRFLRKICEETPGNYLKRTAGMFDETVAVSGEEEGYRTMWEMGTCDYEIHYLGITQPAYRMLYLPEDLLYDVEVIDTWNMTVTPAGRHSGSARIELPGRQYMAIRIRRAQEKDRQSTGPEES